MDGIQWGTSPPDLMLISSLGSLSHVHPLIGPEFDSPESSHDVSTITSLTHAARRQRRVSDPPIGRFPITCPSFVIPRLGNDPMPYASILPLCFPLFHMGALASSYCSYCSFTIPLFGYCFSIWLLLFSHSLSYYFLLFRSHRTQRHNPCHAPLSLMYL